MRGSLLLGVGLSIASGSQAIAAQLLLNESFESGNFSGWTIGGALDTGPVVALDGTLIAGVSPTFDPARVNVHGGSYAAGGAIAARLGNFLSLSQSVALGGGTYSAGFFMGNDSPSEFGWGTAISTGRLGIYVDGVLQPFSVRPTGNISTGSSASDMHQFQVDFSATAGTHLLEFRISGSGEIAAGISVDDFYVSGLPVPEPSAYTLMLAGLGIVGYAAVRRRNPSKPR